MRVFSPYTSGIQKVGREASENHQTPWLIADDANMCPEDFENSLRIQSRHMFIKAPGEEVSTSDQNVRENVRLCHRQPRMKNGSGGRF